MTRILVVAVIYMSIGAAAAAVASDSKELVKDLDEHFTKVPPEFARYRRVTTFGDTVSDAKPAREAIDKEVRLYETVKKAGLLKDPPEQVFWL